MSVIEDRLSDTFAALADPTRRAILARLQRGEASVLELAEPFAMSQPAISKHIKVLERAGLITRGRDAQRRPCRLHAAALKQIAEWVWDYRRFWEESYQRLDDVLEELKTNEQKAQPKNDRNDRNVRNENDENDRKETRNVRRKSPSHRR
jgi:DNA-binding transcriptional ArsR family regulator